MTRLSFALLGMTVLAAALALSATPANAADEPLQLRVDAVIAEFGGTQTAANEVSWDDGAVVLTLTADGAQPLAVGTCPSGAFCAFDGVSYTGNKLTFFSCTTGNSVAALSSVRSLANSRSSGTVRAYDGWATVATLAPNTGAPSVAAGTDKLNCS
ncbi:peptidase inhibitor family I36 protein [Microbacterium sp. NEAU-LLC]|uniref:Peptidase inhibitor family I36 protein n=1 Tax=Microbacterium helvum TaxID=2773713 RepID=A0ABR8NMV8_9MICO|nr:peptidase inhibitor family I36 protein [Microbacterium helvum]MBD3941762.1 peptidase inhibitor family I36 protein [Microbacterium helvum]